MCNFDMRRRFSCMYVVAISALCLCMGICASDNSIDQALIGGPHGVGIPIQRKHIMLSSEHGFLLKTARGPAHHMKDRYLLLDLRNGAIRVNGERIATSRLCIEPVDRPLFIDGTLPVSGLHVRAYPATINLRPISPLWQAMYGNTCLARVLRLARCHKPLPPLAIRKPVGVRVLLHEMDGSGLWQVASDGGFLIEEIVRGKKWRAVSDLTLNITIQDGRIRIGSRNVPDGGVRIRSRSGHMSVGGKKYKGAFHLVRAEKSVFMINVLELEDYIFSVLRTESWPGWPLEVNKALAIVSRSYVLSMLERSKNSGGLYDVTCTNTHQTYAGVHECGIIKKAVLATRGQFLSHQDKPIIAMFDGFCGGVIPAHIADFDFSDVPYLAREYACTYCEKFRSNKWQATFSLKDLEGRLAAREPTIKALRDMRVAKRDAAGLVQEVVVCGGHGTLCMTGKHLYSLLPEIKSFHFDIRCKSGNIFMHGRGFGHHLGLCQWGAREMVAQGWGHRAILHFYYPGTAFDRLG